MYGDFIKDRWMVGIVRRFCEQRGIVFSSWSDDWVIELEKDSRRKHIIGYRFGLNNAASSNISQDKAATYSLLSHRKVPAVPHILIRSKGTGLNKDALSNWGQVVIKPLEGTSGHGVALCGDPEDAIQAIDSSQVQAWAASPLIDILREVRVVMLDGRPLLSYEKKPTVINGLKMFNLGLGATPTELIDPDRFIALAQAAQDALGLRLASVDIIEAADSELMVLEINDGIMMEHFMRHSKQNRVMAESAYSTILEKMLQDD